MKNGIQWTLWEQLDDLDFADGIALLSHTQKQIKEKTDRLSQAISKLGLTPNTVKTQIKSHSMTSNPILMNNNALEEVEEFTWAVSWTPLEGQRLT